MSYLFDDESHGFQSIIDFLRFGLTQASAVKLHYGHGTDNAWDDIRALVLGSLSLPDDVEPQLLQAHLTQEEKAMLFQQLKRRIIDRVPTPYLINQANFASLPFFVDNRVLIPRSPIAELIHQQFTPWVNPDEVTRVLDLCTGSGCIAIACCYAFPEASCDAVDISPEALEVAVINRARHGLEESLTLIESDCFTALEPTHYDIIVSNPPYVGAAEMRTLPKEYSHEPGIALETDNNGLALVEKILFNAHAYLSEQGILVVEVGNSDEALQQAYPNVPFTWLEFEHGGHGVFMLTRQQLQDYFHKI